MRARAFNFCFVALVMAAVALTLGSTLLLRAALCMAIMLILSLLSVSLAYATARITLPSRALTLTRGERAAGEVKLDYFSLLPMGSLAYSLDTGRTLRFGGAPFASSNLTISARPSPAAKRNGVPLSTPVSGCSIS